MYTVWSHLCLIKERKEKTTHILACAANISGSLKSRESTGRGQLVFLLGRTSLFPRDSCIFFFLTINMDCFYVFFSINIVYKSEQNFDFNMVGKKTFCPYLWNVHKTIRKKTRNTNFRNYTEAAASQPTREGGKQREEQWCSGGRSDRSRQSLGTVQRKGTQRRAGDRLEGVISQPGLLDP